MKEIESQRLLLRPFTFEDCEFIIELLNTEGWIRYIGDRNVKTKEDAKQYLVNGPLKSYEVNGFGLGLVELKDSHEPVGMSGLIKRDYLLHPDIGFALLPHYIGRGYAYEIANEIIDFGLRQLQLEEIQAITFPENFSSIRLLQKIGFAYDKNFIAKDTNKEAALYSITFANFNSTHKHIET